jgi:hypothetical protein
LNRQQIIVAITGIVALAAVLSGMLAAALKKAKAKRVTKVDRQFAELSEQLRGIEGSLQSRASAQDVRLEQIGHALDAIAIEVERIGETQRFLSKGIAGSPRLAARTPSSPDMESA